MNWRERLTRKNIIIASAALIVGLTLAGYFALRRPPRAQMENYIPASALAFIEVENLPEIVSGLAGTRVWRELAPTLGLSSQITLLSTIADLMGRTGLGPDEAVVAGRAQLALALMGFDGKEIEEEQGQSLQLKPRLAFIIETHTDSATADNLIHEWGRLLAARIYGQTVLEQTDDYQGSKLLTFSGPQSERPLVIAGAGSAIVIANHILAVKPCLDAISGRSATLAGDETLKQERPRLGGRAAVFGYVPRRGIEQLVALSPLLIASRSRVEPETVDMFSSLFDHLSKQAAAGLLYWSEFASDGVTEKYLTVLNPQVAEGLAAPMKPAQGTSFESLKLIPRHVAALTIWNVERIGDLPERTLKSLASRVDVVTELALREFIINLRRQYGIEPAESVGDLVGNEIALLDFGDGSSRAMLIRIKDRSALAPIVVRYLRRGNSKTAIEQYKDVEIGLSSNEDGRAAAFVGDFLVLGTRDQIVKIAETLASKNSIAGDERLQRAIEQRPVTATIFSYSPEVKDSAELMLAVSEMTGVTDGSLQLLERVDVQEAMTRVPPGVSFTEFRDYGIYTETRSAVGSFSLLSALINSGK